MSKRVVKLREGLKSRVRKRDPLVTLIERIRRNVPPELRTLKVWLLWKSHDGRKVPYYTDGTPRRGSLDSEADRARLVDFEEAARAIRSTSSFAGVGIALGPVPGRDFHLSGIDLDHVIHGNEIDSRARKILVRSRCYVERSPSRHGLHILGTGDVGHATFRSGPVGLEIYSRTRYFTVTGDIAKRSPLRDLGADAQLARSLFRVEESAGTPSGLSVPTTLGGLARTVWIHQRAKAAAALSHLDPSDYQTWLRAGMAIHFATQGTDEGLMLWNAWSAGALTGSQPKNYRGITDCRSRWRSFRRRSSRSVTLGTIFQLAKEQGFVWR